MKKAKSRSKKLAALLALALSASCMTAALPANAAGGNDLLDNAGSFESYTVGTKGWSVVDNFFPDAPDTISVAADAERGNVIKMTKGEKAGTGDYWVSAGTPIIKLEPSAEYEVSFDIKGAGTNPYYIMTSFFFDAQGMNPQEYKPGKEGAVPGEWTTVSYRMTSTAEAGMIQIRFILRGSPNDYILIDNLQINPVKYAPSLESWKYDSYSDPDMPGKADLELVAEGNGNMGAVHFVQDYAANVDSNTHMNVALSNLGKKWQQGKTYAFTAYVKGNTHAAGDPLNLHLAWGLGAWAQSGGENQSVSVNYEDWTQISYEFTVTNAQWAYLWINAGGYSGVDFYIDDIVVYDKEDPTKTNVLENGSFSIGAADTSVNLAAAADLEDPDAVFDGFTEIVNGTAKTAESYDGSTAVRLEGNGGNSYLRSPEFEVGEGDTVKIYGYYKAEGGEPNAWINLIAPDGTASAIGLNPEAPGEGESFLEQGGGWIYFEHTAEVRGYKKVSFLYGLNNGGAVLFDNVGASAVCNVQAGDANADGRISIHDLIRLKKYLADSENVCISSSMKLGDEEIGAAELIMLQKCLMGVSDYGA